MSLSFYAMQHLQQKERTDSSILVFSAPCGLKTLCTCTDVYVIQLIRATASTFAPGSSQHLVEPFMSGTRRLGKEPCASSSWPPNLVPGVLGLKTRSAKRLLNPLYNILGANPKAKNPKTLTDFQRTQHPKHKYRKTLNFSQATGKT